jgi:hypothetical protein
MLPALVPSWRFFDVIAPSPRIHFRLLSDHGVAYDWQEFNPRPAHIPLLTMFDRMIWNPRWNEQLFVVSCAERILGHYTKHSEREIAMRIVRHLSQEQMHKAAELQFRIELLERKQEGLTTSTAFTSQKLAFSELL